MIVRVRVSYSRTPEIRDVIHSSATRPGPAPLYAFGQIQIRSLGSANSLFAFPIQVMAAFIASGRSSGIAIPKTTSLGKLFLITILCSGKPVNLISDWIDYIF